MTKLLALVVALAMWCAPALAQSVAIPNPSFEQGSDKPDGWTLSGKGEWTQQGAADGQRAIVANGNGKGTSSWRSGPIALEKNALYRLKFLGKQLSGRGSAITGPVFCNRDLPLTDSWKPVESIFVTPANLDPAESFLRFGQWEMNGSVAFDKIELCRTVPVHARFDVFELGEGEKIANGEYTFEAPFRTSSRNFSRPLQSYTCIFNTDRWVFTPGSEVKYLHYLSYAEWDEATVSVSITHYTSGRVIVEAARYDEDKWQEIGRIEKLGSGNFPVPKAILPFGQTWVRLRAEPADKGASFQVGQYSFRSRFDPKLLEAATFTRRAVGSTQFLAVSAADPHLSVKFQSLGEALPGGRNVLEAEIRRADKPVVADLTVKSPGRDPLKFSGTFPPRSSTTPGESVAYVKLPYEIPAAGPSELAFTLGDGSPYQAAIAINVPQLHNASYGARLPESTDAIGLWWCSSGWKVSRTRPLPAPSAKSNAISIKLAANEREAAQLVIRPSENLYGLTARASDLRSEDGKMIPASAVDVLRVRYVPVSHPTDSTGCIADWPDPLPPYDNTPRQPRPQLSVEANRNLPLWIRVFAPPGTPAGIYSGHITLQVRLNPPTGLYTAQVPLKVHVYNFSLPDRLTCTSAFGFSPSEMFRYQKLTETADRRAVLEKYWASFAAHHISPYDPAPMDPIKITWPAKDAKLEDLAPKFDFDRWDQAMARALDQYHFNSFRLHLHGMGGGTFHERVNPELQGFAENTPQYKALMSSYLKGLESHLKEKGWLDRAYIYWFDEPAKKDYEFVSNGFKKLKEHAPLLNRMLTEKVASELVGGPNIWCPVSPNYDHEKAEARRKEGEKFWWYVCCGPKAPYCTLFIDHPATELRVWLWQTWQRKIDGILVWQANYWTSPTAYPDKNQPQNPYEDPMGWVSGYGTPVGQKRPWGNGDGRFIYPPEAAANGRPDKPVLDGPVDSIRWEMLRDGLEDYEYHVILKRLIAEKASKLTAADREKYEKLLEVPATITRDMTTFTTDPAPIEAQRDTIARAIEELSGK